jgi:uncharacterized protein
MVCNNPLECLMSITSTILIVPGYGDSGPDHWQSIWEQKDPAWRRVAQRDWNHPVLAEWIYELDQAVSNAGSNSVLAAHSLGCLLIAHWAAQTSQAIKGALLVAVPDPSSPNFPPEGSSFAPVPMQRLRFPTVMVVSADDPYAELTFSQSCASAWGSRMVNIGAAGHVNAASNLGAWPRGRELLQSLL